MFWDNVFFFLDIFTFEDKTTMLPHKRNEIHSETELLARTDTSSTQLQKLIIF